MTESEILKMAIEGGIIDINAVQKQIEMNERIKYLEKHNYKIWKGTDGYWHTYLPDSEKGRVPKKKRTEEEIKQVVIDYWKSDEENPTISEVFTEWNDRRLELQKISASTHLRNKQCFNRHYADFGKVKIKSVEEDDILDFLEEQIPKHNLTEKAFSNLKGITRGFMKRAKKRRLIDFSVEEMLDELDVSDHDFKRTVKEDYEEVFSEDEMPVIIDYLVNHLDPWNIGILLMFVTGIRVGELVALKHDVFDGNSFKVRRTETKYMENGKYRYEVKEFPKSAAGVRTVVIPSDYAWLCNKIKALNPFGEYVFVGKDGQRMTTNCIRMRLRRLCEKVKVYHKSPHKVRKTYGSILLDNNIDQRLIIGQMGHTDVYCTENHYHRNRRNIDRKTEIISAIPEFSMALGK